MSNAPRPVVVVGSINVDFVATVSKIPVAGQTITGDDFQIHFGGKGANQAVAVARLGYPVEMIGMVGSDTFGSQARLELEAAGVGVDAVQTVEGSSGAASITVTSTGENTIIVIPGANASVSPEYLEHHKELIRSAGVVLAQLEIPTETVASLAEYCESYGVPLILDPAPAKPISSEILARVGWFTPNETEAEFFAARIDSGVGNATPEVIARSFVEAGVRAVVLKLGSRGVLMHDGREAQFLPAPPVNAVDTTAAGDAFNGAFATGLMLGMQPHQAARFACGAAAISVTRRGAQTSMPNRAEVEEFLRSNGTPNTVA
ncbi:MAG TPA: ribokinase [Silvibacterium sp.]|nr:ribokinase [Silvibacterium sp.]